ncbi:MAG TPA: iron-containing redox enzyme family protein [Nitrososphaeraceae archaeon]|jgi:pyrroloquinoline-quinone synthase|nr:iron-containing redox enzyme family protein [Nitrososphaeraceae archaeon]
MIYNSVDSSKVGLLIKIIDDQISKRSLLNHRFYILWREGKLTINHLRSYSKEYFQLVKAVPELVDNIHENLENYDPRNQYVKAVKNTQYEEYQHIEPWIKFAQSLGIEKQELLEYEGNNEVNLAIENLKESCLSSIVEGASTMYSFEKELPQISKAKIEGLKKFYNIFSDEDITYFKIHQTADIEHARLWKTLLLDYNLVRNTKDLNEIILNASVRSLNSQNQILDVVYDNYVKEFMN